MKNEDCVVLFELNNKKKSFIFKTKCVHFKLCTHVNISKCYVLNISHFKQTVIWESILTVQFCKTEISLLLLAYAKKRIPFVMQFLQAYTKTISWVYELRLWAESMSWALEFKIKEWPRPASL